MPKNECIGCTKRHCGCHIDCESYKAYRKKLDETNEIVRKNIAFTQIGYTPKKRRKYGGI